MKAIDDIFIPSPQIELFDTYFKKEKFKPVEFINYISSMYYRKRVGRNINLIVYDQNYSFIYGVITLSSPMLFNKNVDAYLENKIKQYNKKEHTHFINDKLTDISVCVGTGELTKYLTGKLLMFCALSNEVVDIYNKKYNTDIKLVMTTSIYGKSSIYNRIQNLEFLGLTEGYNAAFTKEQIKWIKDTYKIAYPNRQGNITAKTVHLFRLYEHLYDYFKGDMPFYPLKMSKGTYIYNGFEHEFKTLKENVNYWIKRWYEPRKNRLNEN